MHVNRKMQKRFSYMQNNSMVERSLNQLDSDAYNQPGQMYYLIWCLTLLPKILGWC